MACNRPCMGMGMSVQEQIEVAGGFRAAQRGVTAPNYFDHQPHDVLKIQIVFNLHIVLTKSSPVLKLQRRDVT